MSKINITSFKDLLPSKNPDQAETITIMNVIEDTIVDGPGFRISVYAAGCSHHCHGCHNPQSWHIENGKEHQIESLFSRIKASASDVTFTGGDPFFQAEAFTKLAIKIKEETHKNIWCYTGFRFEELLKKENYHNLLTRIDVLVDGLFDEKQRDMKLLFRGSSNQRLIDVKKSLEEQEVVLYEHNPFPHF